MHQQVLWLDLDCEKLLNLRILKWVISILFLDTGIGHGLFMMGTNGFIYSHNDSKLNMVMKGFSFKPN